jgi:hypothetical protein
MSSLVLSGDTSGTITVAVPAVAGSNTATLPAATGTVMVSGNMPAFSAYLSSNQSISNNTWTKVQINTEEFDTNNCYDNSTNYRFTPTVAGYYQVNFCVAGGYQASNQTIGSRIMKNGSAWKENVIYLASANTIDDYYAVTASVIYLNGSTDYLEFYGYVQGSTPLIYGSQTQTYVSAAMIRGA